MKFKPPTPVDVLLLATKDDDKVYRARHKTCRAVLELDGSEIRIPFVARVEPGDFKDFMDTLVDELDHNRVRFVGVGDDDRYSEIMDAMRPDDARTLKEAVNGFETETVREYANSDGEIEPVETLVGDWKP